jgi:hypothetical protein
MTPAPWLASDPGAFALAAVVLLAVYLLTRGLWR